MISINRMLLILGVAALVAACDEGGFDTPSSDDGSEDVGDVDTGGGGTPSTGTSGPPELDMGSGFGSAFQSGNLDIDTTQLSAGGSTQVTVSLVNSLAGNNLYVAEGVDVVFSSTCASLPTPLASFSPATITLQGTATSTYTAEGCVGTDLITVSIAESEYVFGFEPLAAAGTVVISAVDVGTIESLQPEPSTIAIKGFGTDTLPSTTRVGFVVKNKQGSPVRDQKVRFSIPNNIAGIELTKEEGTTSSDGLVTAIAQGGTVNSVFRVVAETDLLDDSGNVIGTISTQSKPISVNTGLPNAAGFGIATTTFNPWAWGRINTEVEITLTASDFHNGPVPNGTVISFVTSGGQVQHIDLNDTASCEIEGGDCTILWESGPPYPATGGTVVFAHVLGEEAFVDTNGNSLYDIGESFTALPEPYLDANQNGSYDAGEFFLDIDQDGAWDNIPGSPMYRGASCSQAALDAGHCAELAYLFDSVPMIMSSAAVNFVPNIVATQDVSSVPQTVFIEMRDINGNAPAIGTGVTFSCLGTTIIKGSKPTSMPNYYSLGGGFSWSATISRTAPDGDNTDGQSDICFMDVERVDGGFQSLSIPVIY